MHASPLHLDTNVLVLGVTPGHVMQANMARWGAQGCTFAASAMAWSEYLCGPVDEEAIALWEDVLSGFILPIDRTISERAAALFNQTGRRSRSLQDCIVAATAITHDAPLATLNRADFERFLPYGLVLA